MHQELTPYCYLQRKFEIENRRKEYQWQKVILVSCQVEEGKLNWTTAKRNKINSVLIISTRVARPGFSEVILTEISKDKKRKTRTITHLNRMIGKNKM